MTMVPTHVGNEGRGARWEWTSKILAGVGKDGQMPVPGRREMRGSIGCARRGVDYDVVAAGMIRRGTDEDETRRDLT